VQSIHFSCKNVNIFKTEIYWFHFQGKKKEKKKEKDLKEMKNVCTNEKNEIKFY